MPSIQALLLLLGQGIKSIVPPLHLPPLLVEQIAYAGAVAQWVLPPLVMCTDDALIQVVVVHARDIPRHADFGPRQRSVPVVHHVEQILLHVGGVEGVGGLEDVVVVFKGGVVGMRHEEAGVEVSAFLEPVVPCRGIGVDVVVGLAEAAEEVLLWEGRGAFEYGVFLLDVGGVERLLDLGAFVVEDVVERLLQDDVAVEEEDAAVLRHLPDAQLGHELVPSLLVLCLFEPLGVQRGDGDDLGAVFLEALNAGLGHGGRHHDHDVDVGVPDLGARAVQELPAEEAGRDEVVVMVEVFVVVQGAGEEGCKGELFSLFLLLLLFLFSCLLLGLLLSLLLDLLLGGGVTFGRLLLFLLLLFRGVPSVRVAVLELLLPIILVGYHRRLRGLVDIAHIVVQSQRDAREVERRRAEAEQQTDGNEGGDGDGSNAAPVEGGKHELKWVRGKGSTGEEGKSRRVVVRRRRGGRQRRRGDDKEEEAS
jgi:hypothetical protein